MSSIRQLTEAYTHGRLSPVDHLEDRVQHISEWQERTHLFIDIQLDQALQAASEAERRYRERRPKGPLDGVLVGLKDLIDVAEVRTTAGSATRLTHRAVDDAHVTAILKHAGANMSLGKLNLHEFAYGTTSAHSYFGPVINPYQPGHMAGGSSGGSAVGVSSGIFSAALGTDTGGSIRIPAALSGVSGLKPTYGKISRRGVVPLSWSLDHVGPLARTVEDLSMIWRVLSGENVDRREHHKRPRVYWPSGVPMQCYDAGLESYVTSAIASILGNLSAEVTRGPLVDIEAIWLAQSIIIGSEALSYHWESLREHEGQYQWDVAERLKSKATVTALEYIQALRYRQEMTARYDDWFRSYDLIIMPTVPMTAPSLETLRVKTSTGQDEDVRAALTRFTAPFNFLGLPALSIPWGLFNGLPVGIQCIAPRGADGDLLLLGLRIQEAYPDAITIPPRAVV